MFLRYSEELLKGFLKRNKIYCQRHIDAKLDFLIKVFEENGYEKNELMKIMNEMSTKRNNTANSQNTDREDSHQGFTSLFGILGLTPNFLEEFKKARYKVIFKS